MRRGPGGRVDRGPDLRAVRDALDARAVRAFGGPAVEALRVALEASEVTSGDGAPGIAVRGRPVGRVLPYGSVVLDQPAVPPPARVVEMDRDGHVTALVRRGPRGGFEAAWVRTGAGAVVAVLPGGADHPVWGASDRLVRLEGDPVPELLTVCEAVGWDRIAAIPAVADPTRLPPGAGTAVLNLLAGLAEDQGQAPLRYQGPYPTEQLFWALVESFRFDGAVADPVAVFTGGVEATFSGTLPGGRRGESGGGGGPGDTGTPARPHAPPVDWTPAPHERRLPAPGLGVALREGVITVTWQGRAYHRPEIQGLRRREHRVVREVDGPDGHPRYVASLWALDRALEDHWILDPAGDVLAGPLPVDPGADGDEPLAPPWRDALGALLPLEATPLLAGALDAVWPSLTLAWGAVPGDLVHLEGPTLRLSRRLADLYRAEWTATPGVARRPLARRLVRDVVGLLGDPVRRAAARWLEALPAVHQESELARAARLDRLAAAAQALAPLGRLLDVLESGEGVPTTSGR